MYIVTIRKNALKFLEVLNEPDYSKIKNAIFDLANNPRPKGCKKLKNREAYRIRQGDYRIIYEIFDKVLTIDVVAIGHRRNIYE
ncbi:MAG TPA: type II toxin-antitoxin system RelE/ParE family toxin [Chitinophagales bacterium]|jgi:mRNA interferase RelE/StbE|nr:type II toxin-antitoxin system RelE/ParE family toxin [Chitinophagales bacterium]HPN18552.1 type II toxin-antitoxin system RelE/ParE family toxin [Chitinophagales bacterium]